MVDFIGFNNRLGLCVASVPLFQEIQQDVDRFVVFAEDNSCRHRRDAVYQPVYQTENQ